MLPSVSAIDLNGKEDLSEEYHEDLLDIEEMDAFNKDMRKDNMLERGYDLIGNGARPWLRRYWNVPRTELENGSDSAGTW
ncbi:hypothetical protein L6452_19824 [Arctium lappa]|uniref:Uncharacterized protein n=1 Tax=Arctium lappa TaxID=4217 RepID=A0ACB9B983_ARCLA|nr:hypothetical protein L6452_19824 [Arctium lappa]